MTEVRAKQRRRLRWGKIGTSGASSCTRAHESAQEAIKTRRLFEKSAKSPICSPSERIVHLNLQRRCSRNAGVPSRVGGAARISPHFSQKTNKRRRTELNTDGYSLNYGAGVSAGRVWIESSRWGRRSAPPWQPPPPPF